MRILCVIGLAAACGGKAVAPAAPSNTGGSAPSGSGGAAPTRVLDYTADIVAADANGVDQTVTGGPEAPDKVAIRRALRRHAGSFARCLAADSTAVGTIELVFGVATSGAIGDVYVNGQGGEALHACLTAGVKALVFAPDPHGFLTEVHYPIEVHRSP
jgi:hypothetical protein